VPNLDGHEQEQTHTHNQDEDQTPQHQTRRQHREQARAGRSTQTDTRKRIETGTECVSYVGAGVWDGCGDWDDGKGLFGWFVGGNEAEIRASKKELLRTHMEWFVEYLQVGKIFEYVCFTDYEKIQQG
jgi:hypothetical protein